MGFEDELAKLEAQHDAGELSDAEFSNARAELISRSDSSTETASGNRHVTEIESIDDQWRIERRQYEIPNDRGYTVPERFGSPLKCVMAGVVFALLWTGLGLLVHFPTKMIVGGCIGAVFPVLMMIAEGKKADRYNNAREIYHARREAAEARQRKLDSRRRNL